MGEKLVLVFDVGTQSTRAFFLIKAVKLFADIKSKPSLFIPPKSVMRKRIPKIIGMQL